MRDNAEIKSAAIGLQHAELARDRKLRKSGARPQKEQREDLRDEDRAQEEDSVRRRRCHKEKPRLH